METAVERWHSLLAARAQQMDLAYARLGRTSADFWDRRAKTFHKVTKDTVTQDPFFQRVSQAMTLQASVLDVGAGTGRFTLALAPLVSHVIAVEPNKTMLGYLRRDATARGISNITLRESTWQDTEETIQADFVICSHVLYPIQDIVPFLEKLVKATRQACYIYLRVNHIDAVTNHLWRHFHGEDRCLSPSYIHVLDILFEMGIYADVEIVRLPPAPRYGSIEQAVEELVEQLILPDTQDTRKELRVLVKQWLVEREGELVPPIKEMLSAIVKIRSA